MFFPISNHYLDEDEISVNNEILEFNENTDIPENKYLENVENICFICLEIKDCFENKNCVPLHGFFYLKTCNCNGWIHLYCLNLWFDKKKNCPYCLRIMFKKSSLSGKKLPKKYLEFINNNNNNNSNSNINNTNSNSNITSEYEDAEGEYNYYENVAIIIKNACEQNYYCLQKATILLVYFCFLYYFIFLFSYILDELLTFTPHVVVKG